jgi:hypothetical protein
MRQDPIRLKNLLRSAESQQLSLVWKKTSEGLALFLNQELFSYYDLPLEVPKSAIVTKRFHLKPLLRVLGGMGNYYLLTLSQKQAKLFEDSTTACKSGGCRACTRTPPKPSEKRRRSRTCKLIARRVAR